MARIGLKYFKYSPIDADTGKYTGSKLLGGAIESKVSLDIAEAELYADDTLAESCKQFTKGTITLGVADDDDAVFADLLGQTKSTGTTNSNEYTMSTNDIAPYCGFGRIVTKMVKGVRKYKVEFFLKVQFTPFVADAKTKGDKLEFTTPSIEGTIFALSDGSYEKHQTFDTEAAAQTYLDGLMAAAAA